MELQGKRILIVGLGESGLAMAKWLARQGASLRVADSRTNPPNREALAAERVLAQRRRVLGAGEQRAGLRGAPATEPGEQLRRGVCQSPQHDRLRASSRCRNPRAPA